MQRPSNRHAQGFTLVEMMIVVAIMAVLTTVAVVAYSRHIKHSRMVEAKEMVGRIQLRQEAYFEANGTYCPADEHPTFDGKFGAKPWNPTAIPGWGQLSIQVDKGATFFCYQTGAGVPPNFMHGTDLVAAALGLTEGRPWYYVRARADMRENGAPETMVIGTSERTQLIVRDEGE